MDGTLAAYIITEAHLSYEGIGEHFKGMRRLITARCFCAGWMVFHTNFAESYHNLLKRGVVGTFHHVSEKHPPRYLAEFDRR